MSKDSTLDLRAPNQSTFNFQAFFALSWKPPSFSSVPSWYLYSIGIWQGFQSRTGTKKTHLVMKSVCVLKHRHHFRSNTYTQLKKMYVIVQLDPEPWCDNLTWFTTLHTFLPNETIPNSIQRWKSFCEVGSAHHRPKYYRNVKKKGPQVDMFLR